MNIMAKNKLQKFKELETFTNTIQPEKKDLLKGFFSLKGNWHKEFKNNNPIVLELGCGKGEYTVNLAKKFPEINYIGVDIKGSRIWKGAKFAIENKLTNVRFLRTQVEFLPSIFSKNEVSEIWITFPDPQIKYRRRKKRLTALNMLNRYKDVLKKDSLLHLKTDSQFLHGYTLGVLEKIEGNIIVSSHDIYNSNLIQKYQILNIQTFYEKQFLKNNQPITYICFQIH
jgi:tRNA (guanine-N7-)-methyltransferase